MVSCDILSPDRASHPDICCGDHCFSDSNLTALLFTDSGTALFPGWRHFLSSASSWAKSDEYPPRFRLFRWRSRHTVDWFTPIASAISLFSFPCRSNKLIAYLCSEFNCLYFINTKLINLRENGFHSPFFVLIFIAALYLISNIYFALLFWNYAMHLMVWIRKK